MKIMLHIELTFRETLSDFIANCTFMTNSSRGCSEHVINHWTMGFSNPLYALFIYFLFYVSFGKAEKMIFMLKFSEFTTKIKLLSVRNGGNLHNSVHPEWYLRALLRYGCIGWTIDWRG